MQYPGIMKVKTEEQVKADVAVLRKACPELWRIRLAPLAHSPIEIKERE
jgi:hypothetical protein